MNFKFEEDFDTKQIRCFEVARLTLGKNQSAKLVLAPDGLHLFYDLGSEEFVHRYDATGFQWKL